MTLTVRDLSVVRGGRTVLDRIALDAPAGAVTALIGANGAGKSTLLSAVLGLVPSTGEIRLAGDDLRALSGVARARRLAWVPQRSALTAGLDVTAVVAGGRWCHAPGRLGDADHAAIADALAATDTSALAARPFAQLSCGEQQRVLVARALATGATAILLDEPVASLDLGHALDLLALLRALSRQGRTVVVVLHQLALLECVADHVVLLDHGQVTASGSPASVLETPALAAAFGVRPLPMAATGFARVR